MGHTTVTREPSVLLLGKRLFDRHLVLPAGCCRDCDDGDWLGGVMLLHR